MGNLKVKNVEVNEKKKNLKKVSYVMIWLLLDEKIQNF